MSRSATDATTNTSVMQPDGSAETVQEVLAALRTDAEIGLSADEAKARLAEIGPNEIPKASSENWVIILLRQFQSSVVVLLLIAAAISFFTHEILQAAAILAAVAINASVGFVTEIKAKISLEKLAVLAGLTARVRRGGSEDSIPVQDLVPGDIVILEAGSRVPADLRIIECASLTADESAMTGESVPVCKCRTDSVVATEGQLFHGSLVLAGRARAVVTSTGLRTKLGELGRLLGEVRPGATPLEKRLDSLGQHLTLLVLFLCVLIGSAGLIRHNDLWLMLKTGIALAVAAIPEGLPVVATLALAIGTQRMVRANALIKHLSAVEALGCTTVICTDKTGTLTRNQMVVTDVVLEGRHIRISGSGLEPSGALSEGGEALDSADLALAEVLRAGALCNDARIEDHNDGHGWHMHGDPTEAALLVAARKIGLKQESLVLDYPRLGEIPFDLQRKRMTTIHRHKDAKVVCYTKGSPEAVIPLCSKVLIGSNTHKVTPEIRQWFSAQNDRLAGEGLRVLALALKSLPYARPSWSAAEIEEHLTLLGLVAMADRPKEGVAEAIKLCQQAGIRIIMLTGDQPATAEAIARELHILSDDLPQTATLTGKRLRTADKKELSDILKTTVVLARITPDLKLSVVKSLQDSGEIVAMTGDGVNDAPALKQADIGVAMGEKGADLARESAQMVITDDNFTTIVKAVKEGRIIYENIKRAVCYLLTASLAAVMVVAGNVLWGATLVISPLQILWINLIMHVFPALAIVVKEGDPGIMQRPPRPAGEFIIGRPELVQIVVRSLVVCASVALSEQILQEMDGAHLVSTGVLTAISFSLLLQSWSWMSVATKGSNELDNLFTRQAAVHIFMLCGYAMMLAAIYMPPLQIILGTQALNLPELAAVACTSLIGFLFSMPLSRLEMKELRT